MILLIYENGTPRVLSGPITEELVEEFDAGLVQIFDLSIPVTQLNDEMAWEEVESFEGKGTWL